MLSIQYYVYFLLNVLTHWVDTMLHSIPVEWLSLLGRLINKPV
ncbi:hypothetical protein [Sediminibacterium roseum]|nr:hypothetical protein [Sediminibacterium roseum]